MWVYHQATGALIGPDGKQVGCGYSGHGHGVNNPMQEQEPDIGPIPRGTYEIGTFFHDAEKGPLVAHLNPIPGTNTWGRSGFMLHGDNKKMNHTASEGCIILGKPLREMIAGSGDKQLEVVA